MAEDLATLEARLEALREAMDSGELQVSQDGNSVRYRDTADMFTAIRSLERRIAKLKGGGRRRQRRMFTRSGW